MVGLKASELNLESDSDSKMEKGKHIIDAKPSAIVSTTKIQPKDLEEPKEGEHIFHSQMWVNDVPLHYIVDNGIQKNLILA